MQQLISRFGGTPALILKLLFLGVINGAAVWALPQLISSGGWVMLAVLLISTLALDYFMLTKRFIPAKYVVIGAILLVTFQLIPIGYTAAMAFTNYSTGHIGTKEDAISAIEANSLSETEDSVQYSMLLLNDQDGNLVFGLTEIAVEPVDGGTTETGTDGTTAASPEPSVETEFGPSDEAAASPEPSVQTEFGPSDEAAASPEPSVQTEFGPGEVASVAPSVEASQDMNVVTEPEGGWPPTYIGTAEGLDPVDPADVQRDEFGTVIGITGYTPVPEADYPSLDEQIASLKVPGPSGGYIVAQGFTAATELSPVVVYDAEADTFTNTQTGVVYVDNGSGIFANPDNPEDELLPGWRTGVGFNNFYRIVTDPDITGPFFRVFIWTFVFAFLTVLLTFAFGLLLAMALNKPGMKGQRVYRSLLIIPYAVPGFLSILVFRGLLNDDFGAINTTLGLSIPWLYDPNWAKVSVLLVNLWLGVPYMFLVSTGALQAIPSEMQEAARIDGARPWQVFRLVNLPLLLVALTPLMVASFAFNFNNFNAIYLLTGGGPAMDGSSVAGATDILISYTYKIAFSAGRGNDFGLASAISIIIFLIVGTISGISFARSKALREDRT